jgi:2-succinyl-5-enolpyruvyl-6-hydroxy-3-cyclohexene-1-carboxylate synthase
MPALEAPQVLRLGPLPASRRLHRWLATQQATQVLVSEGDGRPLDPLGVVRAQDAAGLEAWVAALSPKLLEGSAGGDALALAGRWTRAEAAVQALLASQLARDPGEVALARRLGRLLPAGLPVLLANSSPVRDWESFGDPAAPPRPMHGFRGASGIDGTLSSACGLAEALGQAVLVSGDLALLHDSNGWLWHQGLRGRLTVVLIDNGGGGIFEQLPIRTDPETALDFERLFAMPQALDPLALAAAHGVPGRRLSAPADLEPALAWALEQPLALLVVTSDRRRDAVLRRRLRTMAAALAAGPIATP